MKRILLLLLPAFFLLFGQRAYSQIASAAPYCQPPAADFETYLMLDSINVQGTGFYFGPMGSAADMTPFTYYNTTVFPNLSQGGTASLRVRPYSVEDAEPIYFAVWIDFNQNNTFEASELVMQNSNTTMAALPTFGVAVSTITKTITVPAAAVVGTTRMRITRGENPALIAPYSATYTLDPCTAADYHCTYDFNVNIVASTGTCSPVTGVTASGITTTGATISWTAVAGSTGYEYIVNTTAASPTGSGTATTLTTAAASGLTPATTYYAHVRNNCGGGSYSAWVNVPFTTLATPPCGPVTGLTVSGITMTGATLNWTAVTGSAGYEYIVNTTAASPTGSGTATTLTTATASGLTPATTYYAHVRNNCGGGSFSTWSDVPFTTPACEAVTGLTVSGITMTGATLSWTAVAGSAGYEYIVNTTAASPAGPGAATTLTAATASGLIASTTYYAHVRNSCGGGSFSAWVNVPFTTPACETVTGLTVSGITTNAATYDWTAVAGSAGYQYVVTTTAADPTGAGTATTLTTASSTSLVPATSYYVHVRNSCGTGSFSAWVTAPFTTAAAPPCNAVTGLTVSGITATTATLSWTAAASSAHYEYTVTTTAADPTGAGTSTTAVTAAATGLTPATTYYAHVRNKCVAGNYSEWITVPFTTTPPVVCHPVTGLTVSAVTNTSAVVSWTAVAGSLGYEYAVNSTVTPPASSVSTTTTSVTFSSLIPGHAYYAHVRNNCGADGFSDWVNAPFATTRVDDINAQKALIITASPNPANANVTINIDGQSGDDARLTVSDITGKQLNTVKVTGTAVSIDLHDMAAGIYLVRYSDNEHTQVIKIEKR